MSDRPIEQLLSDAFACDRRTLENDGFSERVLDRLGRTRRLRLVAVGVAGGVGAVLAGAQFAKVAGLFEEAGPAVAAIAHSPELAALSSGVAPQLLAAGAMAIAFIATTIVLNAEQ